MIGALGLASAATLDQLAGGLVVTTAALVHLVQVQPYMNMMVNRLQTASLIVQAATLLYGLVALFAESAIDGKEPAQAYDALVLILNILIFAIPPIAIFAEEGGSFSRVLRKCCCRCVGHGSAASPPHCPSSSAPARGLSFSCHLWMSWQVLCWRG